MKTRAGKTVYPDGPMKAKYPESDCRHKPAGIRSFSRAGGYLKQNPNGPARKARRREEHRPNEEARVRLKIVRTSMKNHIERNRRNHARTQRSA